MTVTSVDVVTDGARPARSGWRPIPATPPASGFDALLAGARRHATRRTALHRVEETRRGNAPGTGPTPTRARPDRPDTTRPTPNGQGRQRRRRRRPGQHARRHHDQANDTTNPPAPKPTHAADLGGLLAVLRRRSRGRPASVTAGQPQAAGPRRRPGRRRPCRRRRPVDHARRGRAHRDRAHDGVRRSRTTVAASRRPPRSTPTRRCPSYRPAAVAARKPDKATVRTPHPAPRHPRPAPARPTRPRTRVRSLRPAPRERRRHLRAGARPPRGPRHPSSRTRRRRRPRTTATRCAAAAVEQLVSVLTPHPRDSRTARTRLRLELKPPELGRVEMRVEMRDGVLHASIHADHESSAQLVRDALGELRDRLGAEGVRTGELTRVRRRRSGRAAPGRPTRARRTGDRRAGRLDAAHRTGAGDRSAPRSPDPDSEPDVAARRARLTTMQEHPMTAIPPDHFDRRDTNRRATPDTNQLNQDTFLKLLVAQMKYQDPLAPTDSTQFLTQTAQFTTVSTLQQIEKDQQAIAAHQPAARRERHGRARRDVLDHRHRADDRGRDHRRLGRRQPRAGRAGRRARDRRHHGVQQRRHQGPARAPVHAHRRRLVGAGRRATGSRSARRRTSRSTRPASARAPTSP